ncbi:MAG TPA: dienelactone hydrolase family protein [Candidatus Binatia bacterium]|jgi:carboxymethylenebutenolidase
MRIATSLLLIGLLAGAAPSHATSPSTALPPGEDGAKDRLNASPRHGEVVSIDAHGTPVRAWIVYPQRSDKAPVVIVIHEIFGLTDWIRAVADQLAADGFIAIAPDLLSGKGPGGGGTDAFPSRDDVTKAVSGLARDEVLARLDAVRAFAAALPAASRMTATIGFCWGGGTSFAYAAARPDLTAAVVYYGVPPADLSTLAAPVLGLYGGDDARVTSTVEATRAKAAELKKSYDPHVYAGAGHGFLRAQGQDANLAAARQAWPLTITFLRDHTR